MYQVDCTNLLFIKNSVEVLAIHISIQILNMLMQLHVNSMHFYHRENNSK